MSTDALDAANLRTSTLRVSLEHDGQVHSFSAKVLHHKDAENVHRELGYQLARAWKGLCEATGCHEYKEFGR